MELKVGMKVKSINKKLSSRLTKNEIGKIYIVKNNYFCVKFIESNFCANVLQKDFGEYFEEVKEKTDPIAESVITTPSHYDNSKGTLYKVALERGWNPYLFDIVKRLERAEKKGVFDEDLDKSIAVIQLWKKERNENHNKENN